MLKIFTFATDPSKLTYLKQTDDLHNNSINYIIKNKWNGYIDKLLFIKKELEPLDDNLIVCFIDGYDVLTNATNVTIVEEFKKYDCDLLIGAELNCYPEKYKNVMDNTNQNTINFFKYVNSGGYIGYVKNVKEMLNWKTNEEIYQICLDGGDQSYVTEYYLFNRNNKRIKLDIYCKLFLNMHLVGWNSIKFINGFVKNETIDVFPSFIHFNGGSFLTNTRTNIMPIFIQKIKDSKINKIQDLTEHNQIITSTCYPHKQI